MKNRWILPLTLLVPGFVAAATPSKPNILFFFADDMAFSALGSNSAGEVHTPNLDKLRSQGTYFTHAFNQGGYNGAISTASRAMMNTGKYLWKTMDAVNGEPGRAKEEWPDGVKPYVPTKPDVRPTLWAEHMREAGYTTYITGKWHVPVAPKKVFDHARHITAGMPNQDKSRYQRKFIPGEEDTWCPTDTTMGGYWKGGLHWSEVQRNDALDYLAMAKEDDKPFFLYLGFNAPHDPRQSPKSYQDMYPLDKVAVPANFVAEYPYCVQTGAGPKLRDERLAPFPRTEHAVKVNRKEYYALVSHLDTQVGIVMDELEKNGQLENTYIIFTADHGLAVGDHGFIGKQNQYDASVRVPLFIVGPDIEKGVVADDLVYLQDVMATALDIAGSDAVEEVDFQSFLPRAQGKRMKSRDAIINCYIGCQRMVRTDQYKMIIYPRVNVVRLYDLQKDPHEMHDLAHDKKYTKTLKKLYKKMLKLQEEVQDPLDVTPYFNAFLSSLN